MKTRINEVTIAEPCQQNWDEMEKGAGFGFCKACSKNVIDFSGYTTAEIISVLASASSSVCGRLSQAQLNQLNYHLSIVPTGNRNWMKYLGVLAIGVSIFMMDAKAQIANAPIETVKTPNKKTDDAKPLRSQKIYGYVLNHDNKPLAGIKLSIFNTKHGALTDENGRYQFVLDDKFDIRNNHLTAESLQYNGAIFIDFSKEEQKNLKLKREDNMIMGIILPPPPKSKKS
ncbi:carboxypeptidase-like regulatory domain-containing protein [Pedobacter sp. GSP4]|uniref:carboxypeptidase-like regulatory domain-containing protein n=1 Tax=Pedobacter sp. GSP4 TaxID=3453716 RepID=UPI003EEEE5A7